MMIYKHVNLVTTEESACDAGQKHRSTCRAAPMILLEFGGVSRAVRHMNERERVNRDEQLQLATNCAIRDPAKRSNFDRLTASAFSANSREWVR
jgi:hypothetical protein